jgi:hypothetical protein
MRIGSGDVKGSMDLAERIDAAEWHRIVDRFFAILSEGSQPHHPWRGNGDAAKRELPRRTG